VTYTATDTYGNISICKFNVLVKNEVLPLISNCPEDIHVKSNEIDQVNVDWTEPTATTPCGEIVLTSSHQPGELFPAGTTAVEYKANDISGSSSYCKFNIVVTYDEIELDISKVVTPDGNGVNDAWIVKNIEKFSDNKIVIVDRWGSVIYAASGYNNENTVWKGLSRNGGTVPTGTYFYTISVRYGSKVFEKSGFIELIR
jgi:gliding motility-associated-like protein